MIAEIFYDQDVDNQGNRVKEWTPEISSEPRNMQYRNGIKKNSNQCVYIIMWNIFCVAICYDLINLKDSIIVN